MAIVSGVTGQQVHHILGGIKGVIVNRITLSELAPSATDVIECIKVGAGMLVTDVRVAIVTASGGTLTATAGDGSGANSWDASVNLNAAASTVTSSAEADAYKLTGKLYTAADTIDLTLSNNAPGTTGVFDVIAEYIRVY